MVFTCTRDMSKSATESAESSSLPNTSPSAFGEARMVFMPTFVPLGPPMAPAPPRDLMLLVDRARRMPAEGCSSLAVLLGLLLPRGGDLERLGESARAGELTSRDSLSSIRKKMRKKF